MTPEDTAARVEHAAIPAAAERARESWPWAGPVHLMSTTSFATACGIYADKYGLIQSHNREHVTCKNCLRSAEFREAQP